VQVVRPSRFLNPPTLRHQSQSRSTAPKLSLRHTTLRSSATQAVMGQATPEARAATATGGDLNFAGASGEDGGDSTNSTSTHGGNGGAPLGLYRLGAGGYRGDTTNVANSPDLDGNDGQGYGGGGGGGSCNSSASGNGSGGSGAPAYGTCEGELLMKQRIENLLNSVRLVERELEDILEELSASVSKATT
jgi:hypothetical protein